MESLWGCELLCQGGYVCGNCYVTFLWDLFGGHSTAVMDGFADACDLGGLHYTAMIVLADGTWGMSKYGTLSEDLC